MVESVCESVIYTEKICVMGREHAETGVSMWPCEGL